MTSQTAAKPEKTTADLQQQTQQPAQQPAKKEKGLPKFLPVVILLILAGAGYLIYANFFAAPKESPNVVAVSGRIEGDDSAISPKAAGRILEIRFREGDVVQANDVIAVLDDQQIRARQDQAQAAVQQAEAQLQSARQQVGVLQEQLDQAELQTKQATLDAEGRVHQAEAELSAMESELAEKEASLKLALFDKEAYTRLAASGAVSARQGKQAISTADSQGAVVAAAGRRVEASRGSLNVAKANLNNPGIRSAQASGVRKQLLQQRSQIENAAADAARARAQLAEALANRQDLTVRAPFTGTVITRAAEPGEVVQAGTTIVTMLDLSKVYLRGFVPEGHIGKVKLHQPARVYLDSNPNQPVDAEVSRIDPQATFTPENTYFRDDRVKQVVGVKLQLKGAVGFAKPGMPADGEDSGQGGNWPAHKAHK